MPGLVHGVGSAEPARWGLNTDMKTIKIKMRDSIAGLDYSYRRNQTYEVPKDVAMDLAAKGLCELLPKDRAERTAQAKPYRRTAEGQCQQ